MPDKLVIGAIKGTCSSFNQGHTTRANVALISVVSASGTWEVLLWNYGRTHLRLSK